MTKRLDAIYNTLTKLGAGKDVSFSVSNTSLLSFQDLQEIYRNTGYAKRAVNLPVDDALRQGYSIVGGDGKADQEIEGKWRKEARRLNVDATIAQAMKWSRAFGAAYILLVTKDSGAVDRPLHLTSLDSVVQLVALSPNQCTPQHFSLLATANNANFLQPTYYQLTLPLQIQQKLKGIPSKWTSAFAGNKEVHHSRLIRITGEDLLDIERMSSDIEGDSIIQSIFRELSQLVGTDNAAAVLASEMKQDVVKIPALESIAVSDAAAAFEDRMGLMRRGKSLLNMIILGRDEEFFSRQANVAGFRDLGQQAKDAFVAVTGVPEAIFFGKSSSGLSGEPGVESDTYTSLLSTLWVQKLGPTYDRVLEVLKAQKSGPFKSADDDHIITYKPLREESVKDATARRLIQAQVDTIYAGAGILPVEYIQERFKGPGGWLDTLPPYDPKKWPLPEPEVEEPPQAFGESESPNKEGKGAPGQIQKAPGEVGTPTKGTQGVDPRASAQNTGE